MTIDFFTQCLAAGLPEPEPEHYFARPRKWRVDFAFVEQKVAVELEGGVWTGGRHVRPKGFLNDIEKYNELALRGWVLIRCTHDMVASGEALALVERALQMREAS